MLELLERDILTSTDDVICHQCNCKTTDAVGLAEKLFNKYPFANTYNNGYQREVCSVSLHGPSPSGQFIANLYSQDKPGGPSATETRELRLKWFRKCLEAILEHPTFQTYAIPYKIGCGYAKGKWEDYYQVIEDLSKKYPTKTIRIYRL